MPSLSQKSIQRDTTSSQIPLMLQKPSAAYQNPADQLCESLRIPIRILRIIDYSCHSIYSFPISISIGTTQNPSSSLLSNHTFTHSSSSWNSLMSLTHSWGWRNIQLL